MVTKANLDATKKQRFKLGKATAASFVYETKRFGKKRTVFFPNDFLSQERIYHIYNAIIVETAKTNKQTKPQNVSNFHYVC